VKSGGPAKACQNCFPATVPNGGKSFSGRLGISGKAQSGSCGDMRWTGDFLKLSAFKVLGASYVCADIAAGS
jgi:hypothetical protein